VRDLLELLLTGVARPAVARAGALSVS